MSMIQKGAVPQLAALCIALFFSTSAFAEVSAVQSEFKNLATPVSFFGCVGSGDAGGCTSCDGDYGCADSCCGSYGKKKLLGLIAPTAPGFDNFISPMTNPFMFEDPRTLTELRFVFI